MECPYCSSIDTVVISMSNKHRKVLRTRGCNHCKKSWETIEKVVRRRRMFANG